MADKDSEITAVVLRERLRLGRFIRRRVPDPADVEEILQDVFHEFVAAYRLPETIEQVSAWLFRVARNRIIDRFRRRKEVRLSDLYPTPDGDAEVGDGDYRLDLALPSNDAGPEAEYARSVLLDTLEKALEELPQEQREVFVAHEIEGRSFKEMATHSGVGVNTLLSRKRYAVLHLRDRLQQAYAELEL